MQSSWMLVMCLLAVGLAAGAEWTTYPVHRSNNELIQYDWYYDDSTEWNHFLVIEKKGYTTKAAYVTLFPNMTVRSSVLPIDSPHNIRIKGMGNGKGLIAIFSAPRESNPEVNDIYTIESSDGGSTWGSAMPVPRKNMSDDMQRALPNIIITRSKRVFICYVCGLQVCWTTRPPGSTIFLEEKSLSKTKAASRLISFEVGTNPITIVVSWLIPDGHEYFNWEIMHTQDNGATWTEVANSFPGCSYYGREGIDGYAINEGNDFRITISPSAECGYYNRNYLLLREYTKGHLSDRGSLEISDVARESAEYRLAMCAVEGEAKFYYYRTASTKTGMITRRFYSITQSKWTPGALPFAEVSKLVYAPFLLCTTDDKLFAASIAVVSSGSESANVLMIARYSPPSRSNA